MLFRLILALLALASAAGAQPRPTQLEPITSLHWAPGTGTLTVDFRAGCMSSSYVLLGQTLRAERDGDTIALGGHFLMDMSAQMILHDLGNCPATSLDLAGVAPGTYTLTYHGRPLRTLTLGDAPLESTVSVNPWFGIGDIRDFLDHGVSAFAGLRQGRPGPEYRARIGDAVIVEAPGSLLTHVAPDLALHWSPSHGLTVMAVHGCLSSNHLYMGASVAVDLNRRDRVLDVTGEMRFLPGPTGPDTEACQRPYRLQFGFDRIGPGPVTLRLNGDTVLTVDLADRELTAHRSGLLTRP